MIEKNKLLEIGFIPNVDDKGNEISYHPEGVTYKLTNGNFKLITTSLYPYLWVQYKEGFHELISRNITIERINKALQFKTKSDIVFMEDN